MARLPLFLTPTRASNTFSSSSPLLPLQTTTPLPPTTPLRLRPSSLRVHARHATFIHRPRRPYKFTQMVRLTDGSTYTVRTTSPEPLHQPTKDTRNTPTWQPSNMSLRNVELDEAGRLAAFRGKFGRGFDAVRHDLPHQQKAQTQTDTAAAAAAAAAEAGKKKEEKESSGGDAAKDDFADLLSGYAPTDTASTMRDSKKGKPPK